MDQASSPSTGVDLPGDPTQPVDAAAGDRCTLDAYIADCVAFRDANPGSGAWPVQKWVGGARRHAAPVAVAHMKITCRKGWPRQFAMPQFWDGRYDAPSLKGPEVARI